jgi:hypothetical protein
MKVGDKIKTAVMHGAFMADVDAIVVDIDHNMVCLAYIVCGKKLWGWVPRHTLQA